MTRVLPVLRNAVLLAAVLLLAWGATAGGPRPQLPAGFMAAFTAMRDLYALHPAVTLALFCLLHALFATLLPVPAGCTALNITAGAVFGFARGCFVVYAITLASGTAVFLLAPRLRNTKIWARYRSTFDRIGSKVRQGGPLVLIALRLSPVFPYGALNLFLGLAEVPLRTFLLTTFVGIFFDVVLLNAIGAAYATGGPAVERNWLFATFLTLWGLAVAGNAFLEKVRERRVLESSVPESAAGNGGHSVPVGLPEAGRAPDGTGE